MSGAMNQRKGADAAPTSDSVGDVDSKALARVVRHRRHRFPALDRVVKVRDDDREHAVLAAAADRAGLTVAGSLGGAGLSVAGEGLPPSQAVDRELLARSGRSMGRPTLRV